MKRGGVRPNRSTKEFSPFDVFKRVRLTVGFLFGLSGILNLLALTGALYMLQIYDRALTSQSVPTLLALSILAIGLYLCHGLLDITRSQILVRLAAGLPHWRTRSPSTCRVMASRWPRPRTAAATSTLSASSCRVRVRTRCSICHGCRCTLCSCIFCTPGSAYLPSLAP